MKKVNQAQPSYWDRLNDQARGFRSKTYPASLPAAGRPDRCPMGAILQSAKVLQELNDVGKDG